MQFSIIIITLLLSFNLYQAKQFSFNQNPIIIKTGLHNMSYLTDYDANNHKFAIVNDTFVIIYDILSNIKYKYSQKVMFDVTVPIASIKFSSRGTIFVTSTPVERFYEFSMTGSLIGTYSMWWRTNSTENSILLNNHKNSTYYVGQYYNYYYYTASYNGNNSKIAYIGIDEFNPYTHITSKATLSIGSYTGNLIVSSVNSILIYNNTNNRPLLNISKNNNQKDIIDVDPIFVDDLAIVIEHSSEFIMYITNKALTIYSYDGFRYQNCNFTFNNLNISYHKNFGVIAFVNSAYRQNNAIYPKIIFNDLICNTVYKLDYGSAFSKVYNELVYFDIGLNAIIANVNDEIKIWSS